MQIPDVEMIRAEFLEAGIEVVERVRLVWPAVLLESTMFLRLFLSAAPTMRSLLPFW